MTIQQALILGLLQGFTEFLPVSSSGHLVLGQKLLGFSEPPVVFDIIIHVGTLTAVLFFFRRILAKLVQETVICVGKGQLNRISPLVSAVVVGTLPAIAVGLLLNNYLEQIFNSVGLVSVALVGTAGLLFSTTFIRKTTTTLERISWLDGLVIGILQALAILPGISRSGSTVVAGLWRKLDREAAFTFSFLLSIPAIIGAMALQVKDFSGSVNGQMLPTLVGFLAAAISGYTALVIFKKSVVQGKLAYFGIYCILVGIAAGLAVVW